MLNNAHALHTDLSLQVGGSIGMRISLVKKKLSILSLFKEGICEGTKSNGFHIYSVV
jgi:hypothetical protein